MSRHTEAEFTRYGLAMNDMRTVSEVARLVAEHDPNFDLFGLERPVIEAATRGGQGPQGEAMARRAKAYIVALGNSELRSVVETGLIVTYARPFVEGRGHGFPLSHKRFVSKANRVFHLRMLDLRHQVQAHSDASAPAGFQRSVTHAEGADDSWSMTWTGPRLLSSDELRTLADLADEVTARLKEAVKHARDAK